MKIKTFAHRGGSVEAFGCTLSAAMRSFSLGLDVEIDVRACADSIVCTHYSQLGENPLGADALKAFRVDQLRQYVLTQAGPQLRPFSVDGGIADRIPTLVEILVAAAVAPTRPTVLLDLKEDDAGLAVAVRSIVNWTGMQDRVLYGLHRPSEVENWGDYLDHCLAFCTESELGDFANTSVRWIRLWQSWLEDSSSGALTDQRGLMNVAHCRNGNAQREVCIMTGQPNLVGGGVCNLQQIHSLIELGANALIINDPSLCVLAKTHC